MASPSQILKLLVTADVDGAVSSLKKVGDAAERDLGKAETQAEQTSARLTKMGAASLAAGAVMATALFKTIKPASDLAEAINVTGLTFGESADEMEKWADGAAKSVGLAKDEALSAAAAIGGLLNNVGFLGDESADLSRDLVTLAADMGSAFNMSTVEALEAIRSGLAGESEPLKRFNVFLSEAAVNAKAMEMGLSDGTGALSEHEKAQARLAIIMEQTSAIQGDFANTADGAANASKIMAAELRNAQAVVGEAVLPIFQKAIGAVNALAGGFNGLPGPVKDATGTIAVLATGLTLASGAAMTMLGRIKDLNAMLTAMSAKLGMSRGALIAWGAAITAAITLQQEWNHARERSNNADEAFTDGLKRSASEVENTVAGLESMAQLFDSRLVQGFANMEGGINGVAQSLVDGTFDFEQFAHALADGGMEIDDALTLAVSMEAAFKNAGDAIAAAGRRAEEGGTGMAALAGSVDSLYRGAENAAGAVASFGDNVSIMTPPAKTFEETISDAADAMGRLFDTVLSGKRIQADFEQALDDATAAVQEHGAEFDLGTEAGRSYLDNQEDVADALQKTAERMIEQNRPIDEIRRRLQGMVTDYTNTLVAAGLSRDEADKLAAALLGIPDQVVTELRNEGYDTAVAELDMIMSYLDNIAGQHNAQVFITPSYASPEGGGGGPAQTGDDFDLAPIDPTGFGQRPKKRSLGGFDGGGSDGMKLPDIHVYIDGRESAESVARWSDRLGGLPIKIRGGQ